MYFYEAARAPDKTSCEAYIDKIAGLNSAAGKYIREAPRHDWAMYATRGNVVQDQVTSNVSETANSMMGSEVRLLCRARPTIFLFSLFGVLRVVLASWRFWLPVPRCKPGLGAVSKVDSCSYLASVLPHPVQVLVAGCGRAAHLQISFVTEVLRIVPVAVARVSPKRACASHRPCHVFACVFARIADKGEGAAGVLSGHRHAGRSQASEPVGDADEEHGCHPHTFRGVQIQLRDGVGENVRACRPPSQTSSDLCCERLRLVW